MEIQSSPSPGWTDTITPVESVAYTLEDIAVGIIRLADAGEEFLAWVTHPGTMDELSAALVRALRPEQTAAE